MSRSVLMTLICSTVLAACSGCASIVSKSSYPVSITSTPDHAKITIVNRAGKTVYAGMTPSTVTLKAGAGFFKGENYDVTFEKQGFPAHTARIVRGLDGWYLLGNLVFGGLIGYLIVDPATGAMWTLKDLHVDLNAPDKQASNATPGTGGLRFMAYDDVPQNLRSKLVRIQ